MRKLVILRGTMGCGKSTFIKEHNLERFTLSSDNIRLMFNAPEMNMNYLLKYLELIYVMVMETQLKCIINHLKMKKSILIV